MTTIVNPPISTGDADLIRAIEDQRAALIAQQKRRERIAAAALGGLLAGMTLRGDANSGGTTSNADHIALRAVRYADALLEALNTSTARQLRTREPSPYHME